MFRDSSNGIEEYTTSVIGFINKCTDDVPTVDRTYLSQPDAMDYRQHPHRAKGTATFKEWDTNPDAYKKFCYALRRTIKQAKRQYRFKIEYYCTGSDAHRMWQGLNYYGLQRETQP
jgi:hypothetical protein